MTIQQLSVFIENKSGTLQKVLNLLKEAGIQLIASTIADTVEYGIYRIICSEPKRAYETLKEAGISVALSDVFAITLDNQPGRAADAITIFSEAQIGITYLYSFLLGNKGTTTAFDTAPFLTSPEGVALFTATTILSPIDA